MTYVTPSNGPRAQDLATAIPLRDMTKRVRLESDRMRRLVPLFSLALFGCAAHGAALDGAELHGPAELPTIPVEPRLTRDCITAPAPSALPTPTPIAAVPSAAPLDPAPAPTPTEEDPSPGGDEAPYETGGIDDGEPDAPRAYDADATAPPSTDPRLALPEAELRRRVTADAASLGSLSLGTPAAGGLLNPVAMQSAPHWVVVDGSANFGTQETVEFLTRAMSKVYELHPAAPPLQVGHLSSRRGGPLSPHRSHQSGRDVDLGYFYVGTNNAWYKRATAENFDAARSWELVRALVTETDVEYIFVNLSVQKLLKAWALSAGEDPAWLDSLFQYGTHNANALIRHVHGHDTHLHVRFFNPIAEELGRRALPYLPDRRLVLRREEEGLVPYRIHKGETLAVLAKKFNTTVLAIQKANRLRGLKVVAGRTYLVPQKVIVQRTRPMHAAPRIAIPPRRLPPPHHAANG